MQPVNHRRPKLIAFHQIMEFLSRCCILPLKSLVRFDPHVNIFIFYSPVTCTDSTLNLMAKVVKSRFGLTTLPLTLFYPVAALFVDGRSAARPMNSQTNLAGGRV